MAEDTGSWSRAFMASSGLSMRHAGDNPRETSAEWHEAISPDLDRPRLIQLAMSKSSAIREAIGGRKDCPLGVLASLAHDSRSSVRAEVAANPGLPRAIAEHLVKDRDATVLKAIARNVVVPEDLIQRLAVHRKEDVRRVASKRLDRGPGKEADSSVAPRESTPETLAPRPDVPLPRHGGKQFPTTPSNSFLPVTR